ncbi:hypothetical protein [Natranaerobius trueperi]|uniref:Uncharacterized protein n=1 Tax=Natranaerobius trueperi TaxID=759412 RepID=A0A226C1U0_9FIRM|nr:hypothetical protein [Natranaerobius trueperi]OWZ84377.1 hypothetical protein CDO51_03700 [Natranaerobius trueperi]
MKQFEELLNNYYLSFDKLEKECPKHQKTRDTLVEVAKIIATDNKFLDYVKRKKRLPLIELVLRTGVSKKTLKRGRKYILAVTLIISDNRFVYLKSLFSLPIIKSDINSPKGDEDSE